MDDDEDTTKKRKQIMPKGDKLFESLRSDYGEFFMFYNNIKFDQEDSNTYLPMTEWKNYTKYNLKDKYGLVFEQHRYDGGL